MKRLLTLFSAVIFLVACQPKATPKGLIEREKMIQVLTDVHIVEGYTSTIMDADTMKQAMANYLNVVYKKHQVDSVQFKNSLKYYSAQPKVLNEMYDQVLKNLDQKDNNGKGPLPKE